MFPLQLLYHIIQVCDVLVVMVASATWTLSSGRTGRAASSRSLVVSVGFREPMWIPKAKRTGAYKEAGSRR